MSRTDVSKVAVNCAATLGGSAADAETDTITVNATSGDDVILVTSENGVVKIGSLATEITISNFGANDRLVINGLGGDDLIDAAGLGAGDSTDRQRWRRQRRVDRRRGQRHYQWWWRK